MKDIIRSSDLTDVMHKLKVANERIIELTSELSKWKLDVDVSVVPMCGMYGLSISVRKPNGDGFIKELTPEVVQYFIDDKEGLIREIIDIIVENLFKQEIRNIVAPSISRGVDNIKRLGKSKL